MTRLICMIMLGLLGAAYSSAGDSPFIREDRIWNYSMNCCGDIVFYDFQMQFDGTEELDGKTYHCLRTKAIKGYTWSDDEHKFVLACELQGNSIFYLREEEDKVYVYDRSHGSSEFSWCDGIPKETLLYDFSLGEGDSYDTVVTCPWLLEDEYKTVRIAGAESRMLGTEQRRVQKAEQYFNDELSCWWPMEPFYIVEGIGYVCNHGGANVAFMNEAVCTGLWWGNYPEDLPIPEYYQMYLDSVTDLDGNIVFSTDMLDDVGVESVTGDAEPAGDGRIYDVTGREVRETQPGGVYIRDGKKFVGR